ncbi:hypothetical protein RHGRI_009216 [Rhododendron griersonianum]|uniref:Protein kinase domain-containing protein n=1 Tax=Rhododendron griersonianum TaxID=479676 RepID=A0AAV6L3E5_9ERIC|nr:hypothetical protein RHGRI_009216 [Rhododendron griersonianum]
MIVRSFFSFPALGDLIGTGAFGSVYLATLKKPKSQQQLGPFPPKMAVKSAELFDSGSLQMEKQVLSILHRTNKCPYIIKCFGDEYTTGENGENVYNLLLEYASGGSLRDLIRKSRGSGLPESDVRLYTRSILLGIKHVHDCGLLHLDIKPDNILLFPCASRTTGSTKFMAKICDFGLAKKANQGMSAVRGTVMYLSPEAVTDCIQEAPSDVWAIGCVVLELLTAKQVWARKAYWSTDEFVHKIGHVFGMPEIPSGISEEGKEFLKGCFQRRAADRLTVDVLLELPFVSDLDDGGNIEIEAEESEPVQVMDENYDEERDENLDTQMPKNSEIVPNIEIENDPFMCSSDTKPRLVAEEDPSMCSSDFEPSIEVYFDEDAEVEPIEDKEEGSPRHDDSNLIEPILEDEPSVVYLGTVTNHEKRSPSSDETIHNCNPSMCSSDTKPRLVAEEDPSMCSSDEESSIEVYFDEDVEVEPIEDEEEGSPRHDDSNLIEPILEDEPSVVYLGTVTNHEKRSPSSDETIQNHKRRKLMSSPDADSDEGKFWFCSSIPQFPVNAIPSEPYASALCAAF